MLLYSESLNAFHIAGPRPQDAFDNDINGCLFKDWANQGIISNTVQCGGAGLCYRNNPQDPTLPTLFAVCYNTNTLTPDFTGHIVKNFAGGGRGSRSFKMDLGPFGKKYCQVLETFYG